MNKLTKVQKLILELAEPAIEWSGEDFLRLDFLIGEILRLYICLVKRKLSKENIPLEEGARKLNEQVDDLIASAKLYSMVVEDDSPWTERVDKLNLTLKSFSERQQDGKHN